MSEPTRLKICVVGEAATGKSSLVETMLHLPEVAAPRSIVARVLAVGKQEKQAEKMSSAPPAKLGKREKLRKAGQLFCVGDYPGLASGELVGKLTAGTVSHVDLQVGVFKFVSIGYDRITICLTSLSCRIGSSGFKGTRTGPPRCRHS